MNVHLYVEKNIRNKGANGGGKEVRKKKESNVETTATNVAASRPPE